MIIIGGGIAGAVILSSSSSTTTTTVDPDGSTITTTVAPDGGSTITTTPAPTTTAIQMSLAESNFYKSFAKENDVKEGEAKALAALETAQDAMTVAEEKITIASLATSRHDALEAAYEATDIWLPACVSAANRVKSEFRKHSTGRGMDAVQKSEALGARWSVVDKEATRIRKKWL